MRVIIGDSVFIDLSKVVMVVPMDNDPFYEIYLSHQPGPVRVARIDGEQLLRCLLNWLKEHNPNGIK